MSGLLLSSNGKLNAPFASLQVDQLGLMMIGGLSTRPVLAAASSRTATSSCTGTASLCMQPESMLIALTVNAIGNELNECLVRQCTTLNTVHQLIRTNWPYRCE